MSSTFDLKMASLAHGAGRSMHAWCSTTYRSNAGLCACRIPILVEGERLRPNLTTLLELADYVSMSAKFPQVPPSPASALLLANIPPP